MTTITTSITEQDFIAALDAAENAVLAASGTATLRSGTYLLAPTDNDTEGIVSRTWSTIRSALIKLFREGKQVLVETQERIDAAVHQALEEAGSKAAEVRARLHAEVEEFIAGILDRALQRVRAELEVGGATYVLKSLEVGQTISVGTTLGLSLLEACTLSAEGQISVSGTYERAGS